MIEPDPPIEDTEPAEDARGAVSLLDEALARIEVADECERARIAGNGIVSPGFNAARTPLTGASAQEHGEHMRLTALTLAIASASVAMAEFLEGLAELGPQTVATLKAIHDLIAQEAYPLREIRIDDEGVSPL